MALTQVNPALLTGSSNTITTIQSNGTTAITINSSQAVSIGTTNVGGTLNTTTTSGNWGEIIYDSANNASMLAFRNNAGAAAGNISLSSAGATSLLMSSVAGVNFPATQVASSDANTLDDYEEGTWTPTFTAAVSAPSSVTYHTQSGRYTKIGRVVYVEFYLRFTAYSGGSGTANVGGLPFTAAGPPYSGFYMQENAGFSVTGTFYSLSVQVNAGATTAVILKLAPNASSSGVPIGEIATSSTVYLIASGCYTTT